MSILIAGLCGISFTGGALLTLSLWGWAQSAKEPQTKRVLELQERVTDQQDTLIAQRDAQIEILKEIRDALDQPNVNQSHKPVDAMEIIWLISDVEHRIETGPTNGHLEYVRDQLRRILAGGAK